MNKEKKEFEERFQNFCDQVSNWNPDEVISPPLSGKTMWEFKKIKTKLRIPTITKKDINDVSQRLIDYLLI